MTKIAIAVGDGSAPESGSPGNTVTRNINPGQDDKEGLPKMKSRSICSHLIVTTLKVHGRVLGSM